MPNPQPGTHFNYAQLEGLWINAGGDKAVAYIAAAIAMAESGGFSQAKNTLPCAPGSYAEGLWQICMPLNQKVVPGGNAYDPAANAQAAVALYKNSGWSPWSTYGKCPGSAYCAFLNKKTSPDTNVPGSSGGGGKQQPCTSTCLACFSLPSLGSLVGIGSGQQVCLLGKTQARAFIGTGILTAGAVITFVGLAVIVAGGFRTTKAGQSAAKAAEAVTAVAAPEAAAPFLAQAGINKTRKKKPRQASPPRKPRPVPAEA